MSLDDDCFGIFGSILFSWASLFLFLVFNETKLHFATKELSKTLDSTFCASLLAPLITCILSVTSSASVLST